MYSPAEMLFSRTIRSGLPVTTEALTPLQVNAGDILQRRQQVAKLFHDKRKRELPRMHTNRPVLIKTDEQKTWQPGRIVAHHQTPRSCLVHNGRNIIRRNRVHIKPNQTDLTTPFNEPGNSTADYSEQQPQNEPSSALQTINPTDMSPKRSPVTTSRSNDGFQTDLALQL